MLVMFFDCETTGLPKDWRAPVTDTKNWPRVIELAWKVMVGPARAVGSESHLIRPDGWEISPTVEQLTGISTVDCLRQGAPIRRVLHRFLKDAYVCDLLVAHNWDFDASVLDCECVRLGMRDRPGARPSLCTMQQSTDYCALAGGPRGFKWPRLEQLHERLFGTMPQKSHRALDDVQATAKCYWELVRLGVIQEMGKVQDERNPC